MADGCGAGAERPTPPFRPSRRFRHDSVAMSTHDEEAPLQLSWSGAAATLRLHRPHKRNAMDLDMWVGLRDVLDRLEQRPDCRLLVIRGSGGHFCAGADLASVADSSAGFFEANAAAEQALVDFPRPTLAFIEGDCIGGGCQIALACDLRLATTSARFGITPTKLGVVYPAPAVRRLVGTVGSAWARWLLFTAELIDAESARTAGLVHELYEPEQAAERLATLTETLVRHRAPTSLAAAKEMVEFAAHGALDDELGARWNERSSASGELEEGVAAFRERRAPDFRRS